MFARRCKMVAWFATISIVWMASSVSATAADSADKVDETELRKFNGIWKPQSAVFDGKEAEINERSAPSYAIDGRIVTLFLRGNELGKLEIKLLVATEPFGHIDFERTEVNGKPVSGEGRVKMLYKFEGEKLTTCAGVPGADRPSEFTSPSGSKVRLAVMVKKQ